MWFFFGRFPVIMIEWLLRRLKSRVFRKKAEMKLKVLNII